MRGIRADIQRKQKKTKKKQKEEETNLGEKKQFR